MVAFVLCRAMTFSKRIQKINKWSDLKDIKIEHEQNPQEIQRGLEYYMGNN
jgi:hypothetical protein